MTDLTFLLLSIGGALMFLHGALIAYENGRNKEIYRHYLGFSMCGAVILMASMLFMPPIGSPTNTIEAMGTAAGCVMIYFLMFYQSNMKYHNLDLSMFSNILIGRAMSWMAMAAFILVTVTIVMDRIYPLGIV